jgi:hypothetical protein
LDTAAALRRLRLHADRRTIASSKTRRELTQMARHASFIVAVDSFAVTVTPKAQHPSTVTGSDSLTAPVEGKHSWVWRPNEP